MPHSPDKDLRRRAYLTMLGVAAIVLLIALALDVWTDVHVGVVAALPLALLLLLVRRMVLRGGVRAS
jgi:hypothetical protein